MIAYGCISFVTLAGGNILLGIAALIFLIYIHKEYRSIIISPELKQLNYVIVFF